MCAENVSERLTQTDTPRTYIHTRVRGYMHAHIYAHKYKESDLNTDKKQSWPQRYKSLLYEI